MAKPNNAERAEKTIALCEKGQRLPADPRTKVLDIYTRFLDAVDESISRGAPYEEQQRHIERAAQAMSELLGQAEMLRLFGDVSEPVMRLFV